MSTKRFYIKIQEILRSMEIKTRVVGYQAMAVYAKDEGKFYLNENEKKYLLELSRHSLEKYFGINSGSGIIESYSSVKLNINLVCIC